jgi:hypothetical protein
MSEVPRHQQTHVFAASQAAWETLARKVGGGWYASSKPATQYRSLCGEYFEASRFRSERAFVTCPRCREREDDRRQTPLL